MPLKKNQKTVIPSVVTGLYFADSIIHKNFCKAQSVLLESLNLSLSTVISLSVTPEADYNYYWLYE